MPGTGPSRRSSGDARKKAIVGKSDIEAASRAHKTSVFPPRPYPSLKSFFMRGTFPWEKALPEGGLGGVRVNRNRLEILFGRFGSMARYLQVFEETLPQ